MDSRQNVGGLSYIWLFIGQLPVKTIGTKRQSAFSDGLRITSRMYDTLLFAKFGQPTDSKTITIGRL
jgi:hypothetical protein